MTWSVLIQFDLLTVLSSDLSCLAFLFVYGDDCSYNNRRSIDSIGDDAIQGGPCNLVLKQKWCNLMEHQCRHDGVSSTNSGFCKFKKAKKPPNQPIDTLGVATYIHRYRVILITRYHRQPLKQNKTFSTLHFSRNTLIEKYN